MLAVGTHFPSKSLKFPLLRENRVFWKITKKVSTLCRMLKNVWNFTWMILIIVLTKLPSHFLKFWLVAIFWAEIGPFLPIFHLFYPFRGHFCPKNGDQTKSQKWLSNFVKTIIRIIHVKFQTFLSILGRVDTFFVIFQKTRFSFNKGNLRDFERKMSGNGQNFLWPSTFDDIF